MSKGLKNWIVAVFSAVILVCYLSSFYFAYLEESVWYERITVSAQPVATDYRTRIHPFLPAVSYILTIRFNVGIQNDNEQTLSIVSYHLQSRLNNISMNYAEIDQGIYDEAGRPIQMPFLIESGAFRNIILKIGVVLYADSKSTKKLMDDLGPDRELTMHRFIDLLQDLEKEKKQGGVSSQATEKQKLTLSFKTGRGNTLISSFGFTRQDLIQ